MSTDGQPRRPQSWEHLLEKDPHSGQRFRLGIVAAMLIHAGLFAITWPTIAQAPPREPEPELIPFPMTNFIPREREPEPIRIDVPQKPQGPPIIPGPPEKPAEPIERSPVSEMEIPDGPIRYVPAPVDRSAWISKTTSTPDNSSAALGRANGILTTPRSRTSSGRTWTSGSRC